MKSVFLAALLLVLVEGPPPFMVQMMPGFEGPIEAMPQGPGPVPTTPQGAGGLYAPNIYATLGAPLGPIPTTPQAQAPCPPQGPALGLGPGPIPTTPMGPAPLTPPPQESGHVQLLLPAVTITYSHGTAVVVDGLAHASCGQCGALVLVPPRPLIPQPLATFRPSGPPPGTPPVAKARPPPPRPDQGSGTRTTSEPSTTRSHPYQ